MIQEIYDWLESRSGSPYDFREEIEEIELADAFLTPTDWFNTISITLDRLEDCIETINEYKDEIPDELPDYKAMKKLIIEETTRLLLIKLDEVKVRIGIKNVRVKNAEELITHLSMISKLIDICKNTKVENIISKISKFEEDNGYFLMDNFDITERDYSQLYSDITDVISDFEENE